jgi:hypothetical protein
MGIGPPRLLEDRDIVKGGLRLRQAVLFVAGGFAAAAANTRREIGQKAVAVRVPGKVLGRTRQTTRTDHGYTADGCNGPQEGPPVYTAAFFPFNAVPPRLLTGGFVLADGFI